LVSSVSASGVRVVLRLGGGQFIWAVISNVGLGVRRRR
jgi:hypothetical protein